MFDEEEDKLIDLGFLELDDTTDEDIALWEPKTVLPRSPADLNSLKQRELKMLSFIGSRFVELMQNEMNGRNSVETSKSSEYAIHWLSAHNLSLTSSRIGSTWKRTIQNTRELCDKCCTTIFNGHFCCKKCGFSVCLSCYYNRIEGLVVRESSSAEKDKYNWHYCSKFEIVNLRFKRIFQLRQHRPEDLIYVQYIPPHS